jgi:hypothetical protein
METDSLSIKWGEAQIAAVSTSSRDIDTCVSSENQLDTVISSIHFIVPRQPYEWQNRVLSSVVNDIVNTWSCSKDDEAEVNISVVECNVVSLSIRVVCTMECPQSSMVPYYDETVSTYLNDTNGIYLLLLRDAPIVRSYVETQIDKYVAAGAIDSLCVDSEYDLRCSFILTRDSIVVTDLIHDPMCAVRIAMPVDTMYYYRESVSW